MERKRERYAIGQQDFKTIIEDGCVYVDKTKFVEKIIKGESKYYFLARPRRFGKSLFLSVLRYFYEGERHLFKGLYIDSIDWDWAAYPVLRLDLNLHRYSEQGLLELVVESYFRDWEKRYDITPVTDDIATRFKHIIEEVHRKTGRKVVILVDEYDKPLVSNLNKDDNFEHYRAKLASLYSNFKSGAEHIELVFLTGVSRFSKLSVFSDLNNLSDITFDNEFADVCGITTEELCEYFPQGIAALGEKESLSYNEALVELKNNYDGYRFTEEGSDIFNPWAVINAIAKRRISFYWNDTGVPTIVAESLKRINVDLKKFLNSYCSENELKGFDLLNPNPTALMFQTGYLTIKDYNRRTRSYRLGIPNNEVKYGLFYVLMPYYVTTRRMRSNQLVDDIARYFIFGETEEAMIGLQTFFAGIDYAMRIENENNFHNAFYLLMSLIGINTKTESHTSEGRIDIMIDTDDYLYIIELKYDHSAEEALRQIEEKHYVRPYQLDGRKTVLVGAAFSSKTRTIESWKIKEI